ncbi:MAG: hydrogenase formation protein HypD, partial [Myxococcales bacterium]|nr:hydrogenase formation protein HypD [Myxococcales bacterium]
MRYVAPFRDRARIREVAARIAAACTRPWRVMEVCGGQTHAIARHAIDALLPAQLELIHGPGCPVCVTPLAVLGAAFELSLRSEVTLCSFGDMLRVPGPRGDLLAARALGADVRVVLSPLDAVEVARRCPERQVVFFAVG